MATECQTEAAQLLGGYFAERVVNSYLYESAPAPLRLSLFRMQALLGSSIWEAGCYADSGPTETLKTILSEAITLGVRLLLDLESASEVGGDRHHG